MKDEIVLYQPDSTIQLEVRLQDETVWLNRKQMAELFDRDVKTIGKHINNALREELAPVVVNNAKVQTKNSSVVANFATTQKQNQVVANFATPYKHGSHKGLVQIQQVEYYNLDVILSVGYRVKSSRGIEFRRWANRVLKDYLLRGYAVNHRLERLEQRVTKTEEKIDFFVRTSLPPVEQVFYNGQFFEARVLLEKIIKTARKRVIVIDAYVDAATFEMLDVRAKKVKATIYSGKDLSGLRDLHNAKAGVAPIETFVWSKASHDRWLIVDEQVYHCGHSLKDMGRSLSAVSLLGIAAEDVIKQVI